jgi:hypothetical protein
LEETVTADEVTFCNLVSTRVGSERFAVLDLLRAAGGQYYTFRIHRLGAPEFQDKHFTVFANDLVETARTNRLPEGLRKDLEHESGVRADAK